MGYIGIMENQTERTMEDELEPDPTMYTLGIAGSTLMKPRSHTFCWPILRTVLNIGIDAYTPKKMILLERMPEWPPHILL